MFLKWFEFPDGDDEYDFVRGILRQCYDTFYPFKILSRQGVRRFDFEPVTILYGGNGSGKTTALNVIADALNLTRESIYNKSSFWDDYVSMCQYDAVEYMPESSSIITSDDVFDYMLNVRTVNEGIDLKREHLFDEYLENKHAHLKFNSLDDYDALKKINLARRKTQSMYVRENVMDNIQEKSNGESGFMVFTERVKENALYLLDEPENSLSPQRQLELAQFIIDSYRFYGCQFIISSHSPFLLSIPGAKVYDLDGNPCRVKSWTELENVRVYYEFFKDRENKFER